MFPQLLAEPVQHQSLQLLPGLSSSRGLPHNREQRSPSLTLGSLATSDTSAAMGDTILADIENVRQGVRQFVASRLGRRLESALEGMTDEDAIKVYSKC